MDTIIYVVTTLYVWIPDRCLSVALPKRVVRNRSVGWFPTLDRAEEVVMNNEGDIYECGYYNYCVIEKVSPGLYPDVSREEWFEWKNGGYTLIPKPDWLKDSLNFGIG